MIWQRNKSFCVVQTASFARTTRRHPQGCHFRSKSDPISQQYSLILQHLTGGPAVAVQTPIYTNKSQWVKAVKTRVIYNIIVFVDICHSINLHSYTESASVEVHVYGCIFDLTVPAFLFIGTNCVCRHDQDGHCRGSGTHHSFHSV